MMTVLPGDAYWDLPVCQFGLSIFWMNDHIRCTQISHRVDITADSFLQRESGNSKKKSNLLVKTWLVNDEPGFWTQVPLSAQVWDVSHSILRAFHSLWTRGPQSQTKWSCCWWGLEQYKLGQASVSRLKLIINSSKTDGMTPSWIFDVKAQDGQGNQTLPAESRLLIPEHTCTSWGYPSHLTQGLPGPSESLRTVSVAESGHMLHGTTCGWPELLD